MKNRDLNQASIEKDNTEQYNAGMSGIIPNDIHNQIADLLYPIDIHSLRHTCHFFKKNTSLNEIENKKTFELFTRIHPF